jgi:DNA-binding LytR/AlgR family response regulator
MVKSLDDRFLLRLSRDRLRVVDPANIYHLEAVGRTTLVRLRAARRLRDLRSCGELANLLSGHGFLRVHRNHIVNLRRVQEVRQREAGSDWELRLEAPVGTVLPVSRQAIRWVRQAFGERLQRND